MSAIVVEDSTHSHHNQTLVRSGICPRWALRLRELPCLPDDKGFARKPSELLRRTKETEPYHGVEPFVEASLDTEPHRWMLDLLGVGSRPHGPDTILTRLRALSRSTTPPVEEVERWYRRLDQIVGQRGAGDVDSIKAAFAGQKLILGASGAWCDASGVFIEANETDVPGAETLRPSVAGLGMWPRVGVAERPTVELALRWLGTLPSGKVVPKQDLVRVKSLLGRFPGRIWKELGHWIDLGGHWVPVDGFRYCLTMASLVSWKNLFPEIKKATADLQMLSAAEASEPPFSALPTLASVLESRTGNRLPDAAAGEQLPWLAAVAESLQRVRFADAEEDERLRRVAARLADTRLLRVRNLVVTPYLEGAPAGEPVPTEVVWIDRLLFLGDVSEARMAKVVPQEVGRFLRQDILPALNYCFERSLQAIRAYFEENFDLVAPGEATEPQSGEEAEVPAPPLDAAEGPPDSFPGSDPGEPIAGADQVPASQPHGTGLDAPLQFGDEPRRRPQRAPQPSLIERFAGKSGFQPAGPDRFRHADGSLLEKIGDNLAPWELRDPSGEVVRRYWWKAQCLERDGLEIPHEVWAFLQKRPKLVSLILSDPEGHPVEVTGKVLISRVEAQEIGVFPATYRLALRDLD